MTRAFCRPTVAFLIALGLATLFSQLAGHAAPPPPPPPPISLPYANSFLFSGNYVIGTIDLPPTGSTDGTVSGEIHFNTTNGNTVPAGSEIIGAYLYWETIVSDPSQLGFNPTTGAALATPKVMFRGTGVNVEKASQQTLGGATAACFSSGGGAGATYTMYKMRADIRRLLPQLHDAHGNPTGIRLVNDADLPVDPATGLKQYHTVTLPETGTGNLVPQSAGASIVILYRNTNEPLRSVVLYEPPPTPFGSATVVPGNFILPNTSGATLSEMLHGIYKSDQTLAPSARLAHIVGSGQPNGTEEIRFKGHASQPASGTVVATDPFMGTSNASDRSFASKTIDSNVLNPLMPGFSDSTYGESASTTVDHTSVSPYDCLSWNAIVFSTSIADVDGDGAPDGIEDSTTTLKDPGGRNLPNLNSMNGSSHHRDIYIQMDGMQAAAGTTYGSDGSGAVPFAPYSSTVRPVTSISSVGTTATVTLPGHGFTTNDRVVIADANPSGYNGTFNVTPVDANTFTYTFGGGVSGSSTTGTAQLVQVTDPIGHKHLPPPAAIKLMGDAYKLAPLLAVAGGDGVTGIKAHFDVGDLTAYKALGSEYNTTVADEYLVGTANAQGGHLVPETNCALNPQLYPNCPFAAFPGTVGFMSGYVSYLNEGQFDPTRPQLFDPAREGLFHEVFYVHARAKPRSVDPTSPDYNVPATTSGIAQTPGGKVMVSLGLWDKIKFVGTPEWNASTTFHELGHNGELYHGGDKPVWNPTTLMKEVEPNCKPPYLSVMNYLFQGSLLTCDAYQVTDANNRLCFGRLPGDVVVDYSHQVYASGSGGTDETGLSDGNAFPPGGGDTPTLYKAAWFAPATSQLGLLFGSSVPPTRYCNGVKFTDPNGPGMPPQMLVRVNGLDITQNPLAEPIDWNGDGTVQSMAYQQDVNFNGYLDTTATGNLLSGYSRTPNTIKQTLTGFDDWSHLGLNQTGGGRNWGGFSVGDSFAGEGDSFAGEGDSFAGEGDSFAGEGDSFAGEGDSFAGEGDSFAGEGTPEMDTSVFASNGYAAPRALTACVIDGTTCTATSPALPQPTLHRTKLQWKKPAAFDVGAYHVFRWRDNDLSTYAEVTTLVYVTATSPYDVSAVDTTELPDGHTFSYVVKADFTDGGKSNASNQADVSPAVNNPPIAIDDSYSMNQDGVLTVNAANGVLLKPGSADSDPDSYSFPVVKSATYPVDPNPSHGTLVCPTNPALMVCADGSFTYTPIKGYYGTDTFTYVAANPGSWTDNGTNLPLPPFPLSADSTATVTINIVKKKK